MAKYLDITGQKFGRLTVLKDLGTNKHNVRLWECQCECGNIKVAAGTALRYAHVKSCGCLQSETRRTAATKHGGGGTRLYYIWYAMHSRCEKPSTKGYERYGGRGITVCNEWKSFEAFREWALPSGYNEVLTLDRENNDGNYEPGNCRWATQKEQANNRSNNRQ